MKNEILATIAQGTLSGTEEEGMMTFYRIPYGSNAGRFRDVGAAPTWEGICDASEPGPVFPQNKSRLSSVLGNNPGELNQSEDAFHVNVLRFVKNGNPSSEEEKWPEYCGDKEMTVIA